MDAAPPTLPAPPAPPRSEVVTAWPPSAQWATAFLAGVAITLLVVHSFTYLRWGTRPTELQQVAYRIDLNQASRAELLQLPGVGPVLAERIEDHRRQHGPFSSIEELRRVPGFGPAKLEQLRPWVRVTAAEPDEPTQIPAGARSQLVPVSVPGRSDDTASRRPLSKKEENLKEVIDINRASAQELQRLPGIGPKLSQRIIDEREKRPFRTADELRRVPGIGPKTLEKLRPYITVGADPQRVARSG
jgi:competence protein ComEA